MNFLRWRGERERGKGRGDHVGGGCVSLAKLRVLSLSLSRRYRPMGVPACWEGRREGATRELPLLQSNPLNGSIRLLVQALVRPISVLS